MVNRFAGMLALTAVLGLAACGGAPAVHTITGQVTLKSSSIITGDENGAAACKGGGGYQDIIGGATVEIAGADNKPLASTKLGLGQPGSDDYTCIFTFSLPEVPETNAYSFLIENRPAVPYTLDELKGDDWTVDLTLDDSML